ncbi:AEC family transporter [Candidatus Aerophobetes bacterium]|nr:AEC family transporter [Candidatus Aerophobetes bacterium]
MVKIILFDFGCTIVMWTFGIQVISSHHAGNLRGDIIKNMLNPGILALIAGVAVIMTNFVLPGVFMEVCDLLGSITIPMALIATGSFLWEAGTSQWIKWHILIAVVAGKLVCLPLLVILLLFLFELPALMEKIIILQAAMPSMVLSSVLAERYGADSALAASGVFLTTLVSMLTVPLFLSLL